MAGWNSCADSDDDEPLNLALFNRKSFGFQGFPALTENTFKNIVKQLGATCDNYPKYVFTSKGHYKSLAENTSSLYDIAFIRDCIDANRYLNVEQYRFGPKGEKREYRDLDPCCGNFHDVQDACLICDPTFKQEVPAKQKRKSKQQTVPSTEIKNTATNKAIKSDPKNAKKINFWEPWECRLLLDYIICNNLFFMVKSPSLYRRISSEGFLTHRSPESMRVYFCKYILTRLDSYDLPKPIKRKLKQVHKAINPSRTMLRKHNEALKKKTMKKQIGKGQIRKKNIINKIES